MQGSQSQSFLGGFHQPLWYSPATPALDLAPLYQQMDIHTLNANAHAVHLELERRHKHVMGFNGGAVATATAATTERPKAPEALAIQAPRPAWTAPSNAIKQPPPPPESNAPMATTVGNAPVLLFDHDDNAYFRVCRRSTCTCRYYPDRKVGDYSPAQLTRVDRKQLFIKKLAVDDNGEYEPGRKQVSATIKLAVSKLFDGSKKNRQPVKFDPTDRDCPLQQAVYDAIYNGMYTIDYEGRTFRIETRGAPLPDYTKAVPYKDYCFCVFRTHEEAARAQLLVNRMGLEGNFYCRKPEAASDSARGAESESSKGKSEEE